MWEWNTWCYCTTTTSTCYGFVLHSWKCLFLSFVVEYYRNYSFFGIVYLRIVASLHQLNFHFPFPQTVVSSNSHVHTLCNDHNRKTFWRAHLWMHFGRVLMRKCVYVSVGFFLSRIRRWFTVQLIYRHIEIQMKLSPAQRVRCAHRLWEMYLKVLARIWIMDLRIWLNANCNDATLEVGLVVGTTALLFVFHSHNVYVLCWKL